MVKICFFSDTHLGFDYPIRARIKRRRRGEDFFRNTETVLKNAVREKCDLIIHGGDLFFRSKIPAPIVDRVYDLLFRYADFGIPIIIVPGNHERSVLPQSILLGHPNLYIFTEPETKSFRIGDKDIYISGFPNIRNNVRRSYPEIQKSFRYCKDGLNVLLMHQAIDGSKVKNYTFRNHSDVIDIDSISERFQLVLSGHIHRRQILNHNSHLIIYSGSVERTSFQEMDEPKGYYILRYINNMKYPEIKFHPLPSRQMINLQIDDFISSDNWQKIFRDKLLELPQDAIVRIVSKKPLGAEDIEKLKAKTLRDIFPETMNFQWGSFAVSSEWKIEGTKRRRDEGTKGRGREIGCGLRPN